MGAHVSSKQTWYGSNFPRAKKGAVVAWERRSDDDSSCQAMVVHKGDQPCAC